MRVNSIVYPNVRVRNVSFKNNSQKGGNGWFEVPDYDRDYKGYTDMVLKLSKIWTDDKDRVTGLGRYVGSGTYHVFLENGKAKLGVRFNNANEAEFIYGEDNSPFVSEKYLDELKNHLKDYNIGQFAQLTISKAEGKFN